MHRGLHFKVVLIMLLLILSLMVVVSAFLIRGVTRFYLQQFYDQMQSAFADREFVQELRAAADQEDVSSLTAVLNAYSGVLGIEENTRAFYILTGDTGQLLYASDGSVHRPDRVITEGRRAVVVDYKFGERRDNYRFQVKRYMRLLREMGYEEVEGYLWYVAEEGEKGIVPL